MGINGLTRLLQKESPDSIVTTNLHHISNKRVAVDASLFIYKMVCSFSDNDTNSMRHVTGLYYKNLNYLNLNITPIYIFDGKPPPQKDEVLKQRKQKQQSNQELYDKETDEVKKNKYHKMTFRITKKHIDDVKTLLTHMGISYIDAPGEAEGYASELCRIGYVDYVVTEDMDTLAFGSPRMIRTNIDKTIKRKDLISIINLEDILKDFDMSYEEFLDVCIMSGCDYCKNIRGIGPHKALSNIKKYKTIEELINKTNLKIDDGYLEKVVHSRNLFKLFKDTIDPEKIVISSSSKDIDSLKDYLATECNMSKNRIDKSIMKME